MIEVEKAGPADWQRYRAIRLAALRDAPDAFWFSAAQEEAQPEAFWTGRLEAQDRAMFVAVDGGVDVGLMGVGPVDDEPADAQLYSVWVAPTARGGGVADALLAAVIGWARDRGFARLRLEVGDHNDRAAAYYRRAGFRPTGATSAFPAPRDHITEHELALDL